jgi:hypothetical protein
MRAVRASRHNPTEPSMQTNLITSDLPVDRAADVQTDFKQSESALIELTQFQLKHVSGGTALAPNGTW